MAAEVWRWDGRRCIQVVGARTREGAGTYRVTGSVSSECKKIPWGTCGGKREVEVVARLKREKLKPGDRGRDEEPGHGKWRGAEIAADGASV